MIQLRIYYFLLILSDTDLYDRKSDSVQKWSPSLIMYAKQQNWSQNEQHWSRFENAELIKTGLWSC